MLTKDDVLNFKESSVTVKAFGGTIKLRQMTVSELFQFQKALSENNYDLGHALALKFCAVDDSGEALFSDDDIEKLKKKSAKQLIRIFQAVVKMNTLDDDKIEDLKKS